MSDNSYYQTSVISDVSLVSLSRSELENGHVRSRLALLKTPEIAHLCEGVGGIVQTRFRPPVWGSDILHEEHFRSREQ